MTTNEVLQQYASPEGWELLCQLLQRDPTAATQAMKCFKELDFAYSASLGVLGSATNTPYSKFHACSVFIYQCVNKKWQLLSEEEKNNTKVLIWNIVIGYVRYNEQHPMYLINKLLQASALVWKRGWCDISPNISEEHVNYLLTDQVIQLVQQNELFRFGCVYLRMIIEEFSSYRCVDIELPLEFHHRAHLSFQNLALDQCMSISYDCFARVVRTFSNLSEVSNESINTLLLSIREASNLLIEIMYWDFDSKVHSTNLSKDQERYNQRIDVLPVSWQNKICDIEFIDLIFKAYSSIYQLYTPLLTSTNPIQMVHIDTLISLSNLIICVCSIKFDDIYQPKCCSILSEKLTECMKEVLSHPSVGNDYASTLREKASNQIATAVQKYFSSYSLELICQSLYFESIVMGLAQSTFSIAQELSLVCAALYQPNRAEYPDLMNSWQMDCVALYLQSWSSILDDPLMFPWHPQTSTLNIDISPLKNGLKNIGFQVFCQLTDCVLKTAVYESLNQEEDDDDNEAINDRSFDETVRSIASIGRASFVLSCGYLTRELNETYNKSLTVLTNSGSFELLETIRIYSIFASHLVDDSYISENASELSSIRKRSTEAPIVPSFIVDSFVNDPLNSAQAILQLVTVMGKLLQMQISILQTNDTSEVFSPLVTALLLQFYACYLPRYCDIDASNYEPVIRLPANQLFNLHESEFNFVFDLLLNSCHVIIIKRPLEGLLINAVSEVILSLSMLSQRFQYFNNHNSLKGIFESLLSSDSSMTLSRFSADGLETMTRSVAALVTKANSPPNFLQSLSGYLISRFESIVHKVIDVEQLISCIRGLSSNCDGDIRTIHDLFNRVVILLLKDYSKIVVENDNVLKALLLLMRDYSEAQLAVLSVQSATILYISTSKILLIVSKRLTQTQGVGFTQDELEYRSDLILTSLELLNHLSTKDFQIDGDWNDNSSPETSDSMLSSLSLSILETDISRLPFEVMVSRVLLLGFRLFVPIMSADLLQTFPATCQKYFSFLSFLLSIYALEFSEDIKSQGEAVTLAILQSLSGHLVWGAGIVDITVSRMSLQAIQSIATYQYQSVKQGSEGFGVNVASTVFYQLLDQLLKLLIYPSNISGNVSLDRLDPYAHTLQVLIALNSQVFLSLVQSFILSQPEGLVKQTFITSFNKLVSNRGVSLDKIDRQNRITFALNMKEFFQEIRPLVVYQQ